jgi:hypothetical protein
MNNKTIEDIKGLVRPVLTAVFGIAFIFGVFARLIEPIWLAYLTVGTFVFWFGDRAFKNLGFMLKGQYPVETPPVAETAEAALTASAQSAQTAAADETNQVEPVPPLDVAAFHEAVLKDVGPSYTEVNPCTIFYEARDKGLMTTVEHISQAEDYWNYLVGLSQEAFSSIWGYSLEDAIQHAKEPGCPSCTTCSGGTDIDSKARHAGMAYYAVLLDVRHTLKKRDDLYQLAHSGIDWKAKLAPHYQTLYYLGELAEEIIGTSK